jgi:pimeloyl-ACP methyl ester carboxylesterase
MAWYWHRVVGLLEQVQREATAIDLSGDDESAGLEEYAEIVVREIGQRTNITLVAQSLGAFTAAVVCQRVPVGKLIFVNATIPVPGETAGDWWENTGATRARIAAAESAAYRTEFDLQTYFLRDLPEEVLRAGPAHQRERSGIRFQPALQLPPLARIPTRVIASADDRFFPLEFQRRVARTRLRKMGYQLAPVEVNVAEGGFAEFRICNEQGEPIATFGFADEHEARIARALMIRAIAKAVLILSHTQVVRQPVDSLDKAETLLKRLADQRE